MRRLSDDERRIIITALVRAAAESRVTAMTLVPNGRWTALTEDEVTRHRAELEALAATQDHLVEQIRVSTVELCGPSLDVEGPGMPELRAAYADLADVELDRDGNLVATSGRIDLIVASQRIRRIRDDLIQAVQMVLGLESPRVCYGPGIPELHDALNVDEDSILDHVGDDPKLHRLALAALTVIGSKP